MKKITSAELDRMFDDGEDIDEFIDWQSSTRPNRVRKAGDEPKAPAATSPKPESSLHKRG